MKKLLLSCALFLCAAAGAKAQDIVLSNSSCQDVLVDISADVLPNCNQTAQSQVYKLPRKSTLKLSMYPGGSYPAINWSGIGPILPGSQFTVIKVYDGVNPWIGYLYNTCWGSPSFSAAGPLCIINGTSTWSVPMVMATIN